jgi:hypothetical protein
MASARVSDRGFEEAELSRSLTLMRYLPRERNNLKHPKQMATPNTNRKGIPFRLFLFHTHRGRKFAPSARTAENQDGHMTSGGGHLYRWARLTTPRLLKGEGNFSAQR